MADKRVTVHYRRVVDRNLADVGFRQAFADGLQAQIGGVQLAGNDVARITDSSDGHRMCLLSPEETHNYCFGEIAVFREGDVPIAETTANGEVHLRTIPLAGNEEAIKGSSYFMVRGAHMALLHHESSTRFVQDYLRWLLCQPLGSLAQDELVSLVPLINAGGQPVAVRAVKALTLRAEVEAPPAALAQIGPGRHPPQSFARMIDRQQLTGANVRSVLRALGMTGGTLDGISDADFADLEFELVVKKKERNRLQPLPEEIIEGVIHDGLDRAAEFQTDGTRRRGDAVVASFAGVVDVQGAYYDLRTVRNLLWSALGSWASEGLI